MPSLMFFITKTFLYETNENNNFFVYQIFRLNHHFLLYQKHHCIFSIN